MFGIGGSELVFIIFIAIMLFGADKIPEVARTLGKGMQQLKNATDDIKTEIHKTASENGLDTQSLTGGFSEEISKVKENFNKIIENSNDNSFGLDKITQDINSEITKVKEDIETMEGPIKRQDR
ncbi:MULTISPECIES: Sec-independent protein translocase subunit TatA/TatB [Flavobacterium]|jgi:sec-independent protein translocase protein TatA|uniref:Sec-independent protein translocase protein TatA n=1 Tax=Flavobacterium lindanitolerans TaxID=428988 RepID=A0A497VEE9_9FLAO|nr:MULTISPECIES: twin-arginine translocase TatA/TatE family subunit [Flavobacterium]MBU7571188.1 twin-arginine translocase TatA/TatE family subunit [Flavobacterium sp.]PZO32040.1 MAG: Sec-independent protein translocase TatA [Flavobacteriaceae bacterium]THD31684.1 MAG: Sec-independent protein translocase TatA [Flavobacterium johnsoniae]KQS50293.1 Sec-independent protein translocase (twin-arginine translocation protein) [Flavobacterium sp. Leaf359]MBC8645503.1 twin-arginine translocase TatA/Tat